MATKSETIREALDRIYHAIGGNGAGNGIEHPNIANGPIEHVLAFNNDEHIALEGPDNAPYFSSHGPLTDLQGNVLPGTRVATTFPSIQRSSTRQDFGPPN